MRKRGSWKNSLPLIISLELNQEQVWVGI